MVSDHIAVILVSAGKGTRFGGETPKQYALFKDGRNAFEICVRKFLDIPEIQTLIAVINPAHAARTDPVLNKFTESRKSGRLRTVIGGAERADSVRAGVAALPDNIDYVLIHDAARPGFSDMLVRKLITSCVPGAGVAPASPVTDSLHSGADGRFQTPVSRAGLFAVQTPQVFDVKKLLQIYTETPSLQATDEVTLFLNAGAPVTYIAAEARNFKLTTREDFDRMQTALFPAPAYPDIRVGDGFDVHRFESGDGHITLGGVKIPFPLKLKGHSDADVILHALTDAILGAVSSEDIGFHFSPKDDRWRGADSGVFLKHALGLMTEKGGRLNHADMTLIGEKPKLSPHRDAIRANIAELCEIDVSRVSLKATTTEKLGFTGRGEGLAARAVVTVIF